MTSSNLSSWILDTSTVQAPQDPSPHDNLVPVSPDNLRYCVSVFCNCGASIWCWSPFTQNVKSFIFYVKRQSSVFKSTFFEPQKLYSLCTLCTLYNVNNCVHNVVICFKSSLNNLLLIFNWIAAMILKPKQKFSVN